MLSAPIEKLTEIRGIGPKNALYLSLVHQVARRYLRDRASQAPFFHNSKEVFDYLFHSLKDLKREVFKVLFLTRKNELIEERDMFQGTLAATAVYPREILSAALELRAAALVLVHNHPSGDPAPSREDDRITKEIVWASKLLQVQVLDHIIIGNGRYYSYADEGLLKRFDVEYDRWRQGLSSP